MVEIALPRYVADSYRTVIENAAGDRANLISVDPSGVENVDLSEVQVVLHAFFADHMLPRGARSPDGSGLEVAEILAGAQNLSWVHSIASGLDDIPSAELRRPGLWITNSAGACSAGMAEYAIAAMVALAANFPDWHEAQRKRVWADKFDHRWSHRLDFPCSELRGKRVGLVGYGQFGAHLAPVCKALGMEVWATRRTPTIATGEPLDRLLPADGLPELLATSDFIVIAASLNSTTRGLIGAAELELLKPDAILINVARGELIDEDALAVALKTRRLRAAMIDVAVGEPLSEESSLWNVPNLWITPHVCGYTSESWDRAIELFCSNLRLFLDGRPERMGNLAQAVAHA